jgi:hypothetical protein
MAEPTCPIAAVRSEAHADVETCVSYRDASCVVARPQSLRAAGHERSPEKRPSGLSCCALDKQQSPRSGGRFAYCQPSAGMAA